MTRYLILLAVMGALLQGCTEQGVYGGIKTSVGLPCYERQGYTMPGNDGCLYVCEGSWKKININY